MPKDESEKAAKKARKEQKRLEAAAVPAGVAVLPVDASLIEDVEMGDVAKAAKLSPIAKPLADKKLNKRVHRAIKKASKLRLVKRGVKEVVKAIKKGEKGVLILAGDITPMDIISHLPVLAEEASVPYIFVSSKEELGHASATKRPTSCVLLCPDAKVKRKKGEEPKKEDEDDFKSSYSECFTEIKELNESLVY